MPYVNRAVYNFLYYSISDTNVGANIDEVFVDQVSNYVLKKEFTLINLIKSDSKLRLAYDTKNATSATGSYILIALNGVTLTEISNTQGSAYATKTYDITGSTFYPNDKIQMWLKNPNGQAYLKNVYLRGTNSQFYNSVG